MTSPNKTRYFRATLHNGVKELPVVSYNPGLHEFLNKAKTTDKPVLIKDYREKYDDFNKTSLFTLNNKTSIEYSTRDIPYGDIKGVIQKFNTSIELADVLHLSIDEMVNVVAYAECDGSEKIEINTRYGPKQKKEVLLYDDSTDRTVKLSLWGQHTESIIESGTYKIQDLRVKSFDGKFLTTTSGTVIQKTTPTIKKRELAQSKSHDSVNFPADHIIQFAQVHFCKKCRRTAVPNGRLVLCDTCGAKSLLNDKEKRFQVKVAFVKEDQKVFVTIPHDIFIKFAAMVEANIENEQDCEVKLLTTNNLKLNFSMSTYTATDIKPLDT